MWLPLLPCVLLSLLQELCAEVPGLFSVQLFDVSVQTSL
jgi:hypothetical protein